MKARLNHKRRPTRGVPNRLEQKFLGWCAAQQESGAFAIVRFEHVTLKLASGVRYTPDVWVVHADGEVTCYEVKGFMRDDARIKLRVAAQTYPEFRFVLVQYAAKAQQWTFETVDTNA